LNKRLLNFFFSRPSKQEIIQLAHAPNEDTLVISSPILVSSLNTMPTGVPVGHPVPVPVPVPVSGATDTPAITTRPKRVTSVPGSTNSVVPISVPTTPIVPPRPVRPGSNPNLVNSNISSNNTTPTTSNTTPINDKIATQKAIAPSKIEPPIIKSIVSLPSGHTKRAQSEGTISLPAIKEVLVVPPPQPLATKPGITGINDILSNFLRRRPTKKDLLDRHILPYEPFAEPKRGRVFGAKLEINMPDFVKSSIKYLRAKALDEEGLFRINAPAQKVQDLKKVIEEIDDKHDVTRYSIHIIGGALKLYFRELPEPLMTFDFCEKMRIKNNSLDKEYALGLTKTMPRVHKDIAAIMFHFLSELCEHSETNRMTPKNLGIIFGPCLLRSKNQEDYMSNMDDMRTFCIAVEGIINDVDYYFPLKMDEHLAALMKSPDEIKTKQPKRKTVMLPQKTTKDQKRTSTRNEIKLVPAEFDPLLNPGE